MENKTMSSLPTSQVYVNLHKHTFLEYCGMISHLIQVSLGSLKPYLGRKYTSLQYLPRYLATWLVCHLRGRRHSLLAACLNKVHVERHASFYKTSVHY